MATHIHRYDGGQLIEVRRQPWDPVMLWLQARMLRPDGRPYDDQWYPVSDAAMLTLERHSDIIRLLNVEPKP